VLLEHLVLLIQVEAVEVVLQVLMMVGLAQQLTMVVQESLSFVTNFNSYE
jgi:hypothetical protein